MIKELMNRIILVMLTMALQTFCYAQETQVKYYNSKHQEVPENKARYVEVNKKNDDGSVTTRTTDLKRGEVIYDVTYKGVEPYGVWMNGKQELDYNFPLVYSSEKCPGDLSDVKHTLTDIDSLDYIAPKIRGGIDVYTFLAQHSRYPRPALESGIQGSVSLMFSVKTSGDVANVVITKGVHVVLDKEAARVIRKLKFETPPMSGGKPIDICVTMPVKFKLE